MLPFFDSGPASDPAYEAVRDAPHLADAKDFIENLWQDYESYADSHFLDDAKCQFHQRTWEMYVGCLLIQYGYTLHKLSDEGPEFWIEVNGNKVWVEAVAPGPGDPDKPDSVPPPPSGEAEPVPEEKIILRFTSALYDKLKKYREGLDKRIINTTDSYIVALNGHKASQMRVDPDLPWLVKALLGFGPMAVMVGQETGDIGNPFYQPREKIVKAKGSPVPTRAFLSEEYAGISAVFYSSTDIVNVPEEIGSEIIVLHNPLATNAVPRGTFTFGTEYWFCYKPNCCIAAFGAGRHHKLVLSQGRFTDTLPCLEP
jgi:hypothetical protein